ncbi:MAG: 16S rRNA (cytosine(967)-C(5))-methyltransferase RsmB [Actinomycetota bacterium]
MRRPPAGRRSRSDAPASARGVALDVIRRVTDEGAYSNLALARTLERAHLSDRDAALATELTYGTLRKRVPLDAALAPLLDRPIDTAPKAARSVLRLGAYQILFTRIPSHAAVGETVELAEQRHRGFVNAVLRRLSVQGARVRSGAGDEDVSVRTGLGAWGVRELRRLLGDEAEEAAAALGRPARTTLRTNTCRTGVDELEAALAGAGLGVERGSVHAGSLLVSSSAPAAFPGFDEGWFAVQDEASSFVVDALDPQPGERVLDACAGPGGKAGDIACRVGAEGRLVAADANVARAGLVRSSLDRLGLRGHVVVQDARDPALGGGFDRVLVDAPCSGIGSARRRPELLWRVVPDELSTLARLQVAIVSSAANLLRPGGRLVYSVCTFPRAETDAACDAIVRHRPDLEPVELDGPDGPAPRIRLWPHRHGCDAMFIAGFRKADSPRD